MRTAMRFVGVMALAMVATACVSQEQIQGQAQAPGYTEQRAPSPPLPSAPQRVEVVVRHENAPAAATHTAPQAAPAAQQGPEQYWTRTRQVIGPDGQTIQVELEEERWSGEQSPTNANPQNDPVHFGSDWYDTPRRQQVRGRELHAYDAQPPRQVREVVHHTGGSRRGSGLNFQVVPKIGIRHGPGGTRLQVGAIGTVDNHPVPTTLTGGYGYGGGMSAAQFFGR